MPLVDYTSESDTDAPPPAKRPRVTSTAAVPPPPAAFHDLYVSTVKTFDDPSLHQGRRRQIPHVAGQWPSHVYVEWRATDATHALLTAFVAALQRQVEQQQQQQQQQQQRPGSEAVRITTLLASDLGVPQPLHISLSRPLVLATATKDAFLTQVEARVRRGGVAPFVLACRDVTWHRAPESGRSFLVLRVGSAGASGEDIGDGVEKKDGAKGESAGEKEAAVEVESDEGVQGTTGRQGTGALRAPKASPPDLTSNQELTALLEECNAVARVFGQPELYQWAGQKQDRETGATVSDAFHVSIAWSLAEPTEELRRVTEEVFGWREFGARIRDVRIRVSSIKVKVGNVVTDIPLREYGQGGSRTQRAAYLRG